jgi:uncharacterized alkaline shock family protein YloU
MIEINIEKPKNGQAFIAERVIASIARAAALEIDGVLGIVGQSRQGGIKTEITGRDVTVEFAVNARLGTRLQKVTELVQERVKMTVDTMTGLSTKTVNVNVIAVALPKEVKEKRRVSIRTGVKRSVCPVCRRLKNEP